MSTTPPHVTVCICTFQRPAMLARLLVALERQRTGGRFSLSVVVTDNEPQGSAQAVVGGFAARSALPVVYSQEPRKNIALARNEALRHAHGDFVAFIDDDEFPEPDWLERMLAACLAYDAAGVLGPVRPHFDTPPPAWIVKGGFCERPEHPTGRVMDWEESRTGNLLFRGVILAGEPQPFLEQFGTGGEDKDFFMRMTRRGHVFRWCNEGITYETVPPERWTRRYMLERALLRGRNILKHPGRQLPLLAKSAVAAPAYALVLPFALLFGQHVFMKYCIRFCDHAGRLLGVMGLNPVRARQTMTASATRPALSASRTVVVVAFAEALAAPEVVWSLVDAGFAVIGVARLGAPTALSHSRLVTLHEVPPPEADAALAQRALTDLLAEIRRGGFARHLLLPLDDTAVWLCSRAAREAGWLYAGPGSDAALALALDKRRQIEAARAAGLAVPQTVVADSPADLEHLPFGFPLILRPAQAVRLAGPKIDKGRNWICSDADELAAALRGWNGDGPMLVQPYIEGTGEGVFGLMTDAGVVGWSAHRRLRMMNPHGSGSSACVSRLVDDASKAPIEALLRDAGWRGMFMIELLRDAGGKLHFVEFNGRAWGSMALARRLGLEYPAWSVKQALGEAPPAEALPAPRDGVVCRNLGRELMHLLFVLRGRRSRAVRHWPSFWSALRDVLRPHPGGSFYNWRSNDWRVFAIDCYYTILRNVAKPRRS